MILLELQGCIASCGISNSKHDLAYKRLSEIIKSFGCFAEIVDSNFTNFLYSEEYKSPDQCKGMLKEYF